jgi:hypothetical protein
MRHFHLRRQPHHEAPRARASAHAPGDSSVATAVPVMAAVPVATPAVEGALDQAAALWTTRRIRSFLVLQPAHGLRR